MKPMEFGIKNPPDSSISRVAGGRGNSTTVTPGFVLSAATASVLARRPTVLLAPSLEDPSSFLAKTSTFLLRVNAALFQERNPTGNCTTGMPGRLYFVQEVQWRRVVMVAVFYSTDRAVDPFVFVHLNPIMQRL